MISFSDDPHSTLLHDANRVQQVGHPSGVIAGEVTLGLSAGRMNVVGIGVFTLFVFAALALLTWVLTSISSSE